ncbi:MAG: cob(I)yrinic acid a,c-diamide adenosyltransferase [Burkholderiales bacterium]
MANRLTCIYTRTGDDGTTGLGDATRTAKDSARIEAIGTVDELNSHIGLLLCESLAVSLTRCLTIVQHELFDLGGELSLPGQNLLTEIQVTRLEQVLDELNADLAPLKEFILPGGSRAAAQCHVVRTVCRRAERCCVTLAKTEHVSGVALRYLNRLSDLLFVMCRVINRDGGYGDVLWRRERL